MNRIRAFHSMVLGGLLLAGAMNIHATFPDENGRIAFIFGPDIYTMNPDGSDVRQLTNLGPDNAPFGKTGLLTASSSCSPSSQTTARVSFG